MEIYSDDDPGIGVREVNEIRYLKGIIIRRN